MMVNTLMAITLKDNYFSLFRNLDNEEHFKRKIIKIIIQFQKIFIKNFKSKITCFLISINNFIFSFTATCI
jgi:hypothetical protein